MKWNLVTVDDLSPVEIDQMIKGLEITHPYIKIKQGVDQPKIYNIVDLFRESFDVMVAYEDVDLTKPETRFKVRSDFIRTINNLSSKSNFIAATGELVDFTLQNFKRFQDTRSDNENLILVLPDIRGVIETTNYHAFIFALLAKANEMKFNKWFMMLQPIIYRSINQPPTKQVFIPYTNYPKSECNNTKHWEGMCFTD